MTSENPNRAIDSKATRQLGNEEQMASWFFEGSLAFALWKIQMRDLTVRMLGPCCQYRIIKDVRFF
ncbi:hypothetical protein CUMW_084170 [Citrus unshiu]|nr:hypothetical protein CUMW_084170 [Citrus unshiu]